MNGRVYLVGAGPGRADLLTVRAAALLAEADVVLYDRLVSAEVLATIRSGALLVDAGKEPGRQEEIQQRVLNELAGYARRYRTVVRLKGGDPMVFGRGGEEWLHLAALGIDVEVVPGISSAVAVPALAGIPLTLRGVAASFAVVTGHRIAGADFDWEAYARIGTLIVLMGVSQRAAIAAALLMHGRAASTPVAWIEQGSTVEQRVVVTTLGQMATVEVESPAVLVVGEVVNVRGRLLGAESLIDYSERS